jgi:hypothetical protein
LTQRLNRELLECFARNSHLTEQKKRGLDRVASKQKAIFAENQNLKTRIV